MTGLTEKQDFSALGREETGLTIGATRPSQRRERRLEIRIRRTVRRESAPSTICEVCVGLKLALRTTVGHLMKQSLAALDGLSP